jgi:hypothetical protein
MEPKSLILQVLGQPLVHQTPIRQPSPTASIPAPPSSIAFEIAGGSIRGQRHESKGVNNQDAFAWHCSGNTIIAVVCDGCGSSKNSEVGAKLGARLTIEALRIWLPVLDEAPAATALEQVRLHLLEQFGKLIQEMGKDPLKTILNYFLFTIVGAVITPEKVVTFTHGDGVLAINDDYANLIYPNNAPPYLTYDLVRDHLDPSIHDHLTFNVHWEGRPEEVQDLLIGTDGVNDFHQAAKRCIPGTSRQVGPLSQFWQSDRYFTNPPSIRRYLKQVNRTVLRGEQGQQGARKEIGLLPDDTTFVVIRRKRG